MGLNRVSFFQKPSTGASLRDLALARIMLVQEQLPVVSLQIRNLIDAVTNAVQCIKALSLFVSFEVDASISWGCGEKYMCT
jgi:hypothetical protein